MDPNQQTQQNPTPTLVPHRYIKVNPNIPRLVQEKEKPKESYFSSLFKGRINRRNYLIGSLLAYSAPFAGFVFLFLNIAFFSLDSQLPQINTKVVTQQDSKLPPPNTIITNIINPIIIAIVAITMIIAIPYVLSLQVRRIHDLGKSGWMLLWQFVPIANVVIALYIELGSGDVGDNRYGPPPLPRYNIKEDILKLQV